MASNAPVRALVHWASAASTVDEARTKMAAAQKPVRIPNNMASARPARAALLGLSILQLFSSFWDAFYWFCGIAAAMMDNQELQYGFHLLNRNMVEDLIRRARQRFLVNETLAQAAFAAAVTVGGFALLLIFGTRYMEWWTLAVFAVAGLAIGAHRVYRRSPGLYATAVRLDENAHLKDALSTALYFSARDVSAQGAPSGEFLQAQRAQAEATAGRVQLDQAVPFVIPRTLYAMAALCVVASALIALRFGLGHGLDLHAPITRFFLEDQAAIAAKKHAGTLPKAQKPWMQEAQDLLSKLGMAPKPEEAKQSDQEALDKALEEALQSPSDASAKDQKGAGANKGGESKDGTSAEEAKNGDPIDDGEQQATDKSGSEGSESKQGDKASKGSSSKASNGDKKESLLSRLKDAVSNMLSKSDKDQGDSQKSQSAKNDSSDGMKGEPGKGEKQDSQSQADSQNGQPDPNGQSNEQAQGKLSSKADTQPGRGGSGAGSQDGAKELKEAEQLKAMGKISELIGQRAATVSGETSVEVESGNQKLKTAYSNTAAAHAETDGDVTRDEIPLAVQSYVQQYFAEVRKAAPTKAAAPKQ
jgi:hypothetical protein